ncbi:YybH family protein [Viridibacillus sp. NPDC093762]|uniref:YybH family protein n=1 Tax=Viridibacillus sp. NPDC093762 TaxID=3390720 RepID=UPI003D01FF02
MIIKKWLLVPVCALLLVACGNDDSATKENTGSVNDGENTATSNAVDHSIKDKTEKETNDETKTEKSAATEETNEDDQEIGFEMVNGEVEAAKNVPAEEEKALLQAFDEYIAALNAEDLERYSKTLSKNPTGFDLEEDVEYQKLNFENFDIKHTAKDVHVVQYDENEAQLLSQITVEVELENGEPFKQAARTNTVFVKEDGKWLVTRVAAIGEKME